MKKTPLFPLYERYGARVVDFHGWALPVQFSGIIDEHQAVRTAAGLFDVSHMGEIEVSGPGALPFIQMLTVNDAGSLKDGQVQYSAMCFEDGGIVDDLTVYRFSAELFMLCVNAANREKDLDWILSHRPDEVDVFDRSNDMALLALQGPKAEFMLRSLTPVSLGALPYYHFADTTVAGVPATVSRTGYTGEDGFEIFLSDRSAPEAWQKIMSAGAPLGLKPAGLGARDTLRMEMKYALYGNDIDATTDPVEAGLGWITKPDKGEFIGRRSILDRSGGGPSRKLIGFELRGRGIARQHHPIFAGGEEAGKVTSGTFSPSLRRPIGLGYVPADCAKPGTPLEIGIRGGRVAAEVVRTPFYREGSVRK